MVRATVFFHTQGDLEHELTVLVSATDPVKLLRLRLRNRGQKEAQPERLRRC